MNTRILFDVNFKIETDRCGECYAGKSKDIRKVHGQSELSGTLDVHCTITSNHSFYCLIECLVEL